MTAFCNRSCLAALGGLLIVTLAGGADLDAKVKATANNSLKKGAEYLVKVQNEDGSWSPAGMPGITALCVVGLHNAPIDAKTRDAAIDKGLKSILTFAHEDGSIAPAAAGGGRQAVYSTYNTALSLLALSTVSRPEDVNVMQAARRWLKQQQILEGGATAYGGFGYGGGGGARADLSNTALAVEALYYTEYLDQEPLVAAGDAKKLKDENQKMWKDLETFLDTCHNAEKPGDDASAKAKRDGGFSYIPGKLMTTTSMTYAGLKSMLYAKLERNDPRVKITWKFVQGNYSVDENPGEGLNGLYSYLHNFAKALDAYGQDTITLTNGKSVNWREDLIRKFAREQQADGHWQNKEGRFMESVPELASAYAMISVKHALGTAK